MTISSITIEGVTDANGNFNHQWNDWLGFESQYTALRGDITVEIMFNGGSGNDYITWIQLTY